MHSFSSEIRSQDLNAFFLEYKFSDIRLIGGLAVHQGYVQVKMNDRYGYVCGHYAYKYQEDSDAICRSLGYPYVVQGQLLL